jgi:hypothetical protein
MVRARHTDIESTPAPAKGRLVEAAAFQPSFLMFELQRITSLLLRPDPKTA